MILCPACGAENPDGTKLCVKCATELPKEKDKGRKAAASAADAGGEDGHAHRFSFRDLSRDTVDALWLLLIILLLLVGFFGEATGWKFRWVEEGRRRIVSTQLDPPPRRPSAPPVAPRPAVEKPPARPVSPETLYLRSKRKYDSREYVSSFELLKKALEIDPTFAKAYFGLGTLYSRFAMEDVSVRMFEMALRFDPEYLDALNNLAMRYYYAGNAADAAVLLEKAAAGRSGDGVLRYNLGLAYLEAGRTPEAVAALEKAAQLLPDDPDVHNGLALAYEKAGDAARARETWARVRDLATDPALRAQADSHLSFLQANL